MVAYIFLVIGSLWFGVAVFVYRVGFGVYWSGMNVEKVGRIVSSALPVTLFGWVAPIVVGAWLLWRHKTST